MKKMMLVCFILLFSGALWVGAVPKNPDAVDPTGRLNGYGMEIMQQTKLGGFGMKNYVYGVVDAVYTAEQEFARETYKDMSKDDMVAQLLWYYKNNPDKKSKAVVDVIRDGFK